MNGKKRMWIISFIVVLCCAAMAVVDGIIKPHYAIKSGIKLSLFLVLPFVYSWVTNDIDLKSLFKADKKGIKMTFLMCIPVYIIILGGYMALKDIFDFSNITTTLTEGIGVNRNNFVAVSLYISFVNSLLEEFFFRGFAFMTLKKVSTAKFAYIFSSLMFALYHVAMMISWFSIWVYLIIVAGLIAGGMFFNYINSKSKSIYMSWFVHMFANFAINTVGFILFGII